MNNITNNQSNTSVYTHLTQVQALYSRLIQVKIQLNLLDRNLDNATNAFNTLPTQQNLLVIENAWNQKLLFMKQLPQIINDIAVNLVEATKNVLTSLQVNLLTNNRINVVLNDNAIATILSLVEQNSQQLYIKELCIAQGIPMLLSGIDIKAKIYQISIPNFTRLMALING